MTLEPNNRGPNRTVNKWHWVYLTLWLKIKLIKLKSFLSRSWPLDIWTDYCRLRGPRFTAIPSTQDWWTPICSTVPAWSSTPSGLWTYSSNVPQRGLSPSCTPASPPDWRLKVGLTSATAGRDLILPIPGTKATKRNCSKSRATCSKCKISEFKIIECKWKNG